MPCSGYAVLFGRSIAARSPTTCPTPLSLAVMDVCGAPALTARVVAEHRRDRGTAPVVAVVGGGGKSGSLSLAAASEAGAARTIGVVPARAGGRAGWRPRAWPTWSSSPTPATPWPCATPSRPPAGRPT